MNSGTGGVTWDVTGKLTYRLLVLFTARFQSFHRFRQEGILGVSFVQNRLYQLFDSTSAARRFMLIAKN
ncbi:hypothetical protein TNCV_4164631 [Trichonephila clavipes]|nr:hypothetical protein TNCV_4164631 [Trichonephila clavipes]